MKKILYLVTQSELGGAQRYILDLTQYFSQQGYVVAVAAGEKGPLLDQAIAQNLAIHRLKHLIRAINPIQDWLAFWELKRLFDQTKPDILHLNSSKAGVLGALAGKKAGIKKIIYTVHGFVFNEPMPVWKKKLYLWAEKFSAHYKDILICVSEFDRQTALKNKLAPIEKLVTIHNGIKKVNFLPRDKARSTLGLAPEAAIVGTVANFYATKGLPDLITAAQIVIKQLPAVMFVVIGDGEQRRRLESLIGQHNLDKNFRLVGYKKNAKQYLLAFDLYACSSVKEGLPFSLLEAMQAGLPIVSTNVGGIPEMIQDKKNGRLVNLADPEILAEAIIELVQNKNLANRLGGQAKIDAEQKFSSEKMIARTIQAYEK